MLLLQRGCYRGEGGVEAGPYSANNCYNRDRDACGDETVFNGSRPGFVTHKALEDGHHDSPSFFIITYARGSANFTSTSAKTPT
jgi:hypothetical protein